jgi:hypothetical protein
MTKPRVHADLIKAWADGAEIQFLHVNGKWRDCQHGTPAWSPRVEYRIKPVQKVGYMNIIPSLETGSFRFSLTLAKKDKQAHGSAGILKLEFENNVLVNVSIVEE